MSPFFCLCLPPAQITCCLSSDLVAIWADIQWKLVVVFDVSIIYDWNVVHNNRGEHEGKSLSRCHLERLRPEN